MASKPSLNQPPNTYTNDDDRGVDSTKAEAAIQAFAQYSTDVANTFEEFKTEIQGYESAFYGESSTNVKKYVDGVIDSCKGLMQQLQSFDQKITDAMAKYKSQQSTIYSSIAGGNTGSN